VSVFVMFMHLRTPVLFVAIRQSKKNFFLLRHLDDISITLG